MLILGVFYVIVAFVLLKNFLHKEDPTTDWIFNWLIFIGTSLTLFIVSIIVLNKITKGKASLKSGYTASVGVSMFGGNRTRWEGDFETKFGAVFSALYRAWYLDHFGDVHNEFGVVYGVRSIA
jgi:hypothetical protein